MFHTTVDHEIKLHMMHRSFAPVFKQLAKEDYDYLAQWLTWPEFCQTQGDFLKFIESSLHQYADGTAMNCAIDYKDNIVGCIGFNAINHKLKTVELGYWLASKYQGKGIMTRSCQYLIDYAFNHLEMEKVQINAAEHNNPSRAICERLGMKLEGILTRQEKVGDRILDFAVYGLHKNKI